VSTAEVQPAYYRTTLRYLLDDVGAAVFTDERIDEAWTKALRKIGNLYRCFLEDVSGTLTINQMAQNDLVAGRVVEIHKVIIGTGADRRTLKAIDPREGKKKRPIGGRPSQYFFVPPTSLNVWPYPNTAEAYRVVATVVPTDTAPQVGIPAECEGPLLMETMRSLIASEADAGAAGAIEAEMALAEPQLLTATVGHFGLSDVASPFEDSWST